MMEIDWSVGEILKTLQKEGLEDNTLVIITSDNGRGQIMEIMQALQVDFGKLKLRHLMVVIGFPVLCIGKDIRRPERFAISWLPTLTYSLHLRK